MEKHYDEELENVLLGTVIHYPQEYNNVVKYIVKPDVFYQTRARRLWEIITNMVENKDEIKEKMPIFSGVLEEIMRNG